MKRYSKSATLLLLLLCGTEYTTTNVLALSKKKKIHPTRTSNKSNNSIPTKSKLFNADRRRVLPWISIVVLVNILFFFRSFAAPFFDPLGEPRQATADTVYFSLLAFLYIWLASVTALTVLPQFSTNYNIIIAVALFFYMVFVSICALLVGRLITRGLYYIWLFIRSGNTFDSLLVKLGWNTNRQQRPKLNGKNRGVAFKEANNHQFPTLIAFQRPFRRVVKKSILISASLCFIYSHCWSRNLSAFDSSEHGRLFCQVAFFPFEHPASENSIWILWAISICGHIWAYVLNEFAGKHHRDYYTRSTTRREKHGADTIDMTVSNSSSSFDLDLPIHQVDSNNDFDDSSIGEDEEDTDIATHEKDNKNPLQSIIQKFARRKPEKPTSTLPMVSWYSNVVFTTGFDMLISFKVFLGRFDARKMQVALLTGSEGNSSGKAEGVFDFSHCRHNTDSSADKGFWFDFVSDVGDGFNSSYQVSRFLAQPTLDVTSLPVSGPGWRTLPRGRLLINGGDLAYPDPTPENYEKRFFRTFEDALPPPPSFRREHISTHKPALPVEGWDMKVEDTSDEQPETESLLSRYQGPCAFLIPGNHDWFDGLSTFTRYVLSRDWLGGWLMPQRTSYFALQLPKGWWALGFDLALDDDINIEQFQFFADVAKSLKPDDAVIVISHVPHWVLNAYENHRHDNEKENNLTELIRTHFKGRVKLRIAGDLHHYTKHVPVVDAEPMPNEKVDVSKEEAPILIVSGGGGAFLHPTHCFQEDQIKVGDYDYKRVAAYPSTNVSLQLSWLNLWQFRWRNWRLDVLWAVTHFGVSSSLFPLCGVYNDYLASNPTHNLGSLLLWAFRRAMLLFSQIFKQGRISLLFTLIIIGIAYSFTDGSCLKMRTHLGWSMVHAFCQISSAVLCLLFVEFMAELVVSEGLVATTRNVDDSNETQMCGTGLANTIFDEWDTHFSHTLQDFQLLNITNTTSESPDLIQSCRFDEQMYEWVSSTFSWLYHEAPFLKSTLSIFDLPSTIGSMHVEMCNVLCSDGTDCLYSNDFSKYQQLGRATILKYLCSMALYYVIFAVPLAGNVCGSWLHISLNYLRCQYDEGFSSLRMEHWKNFLRLHIDEEGDLEIFAVGLHRVPKRWKRDPDWDGGDDTATSKMPSWKWENPNKWIPWRHRKKFTPQMIDYTKILRKPKAKEG